MFYFTGTGKGEWREPTRGRLLMPTTPHADESRPGWDPTRPPQIAEGGTTVPRSGRGKRALDRAVEVGVAVEALAQPRAVVAETAVRALVVPHWSLGPSPRS